MELVWSDLLLGKSQSESAIAELQKVQRAMRDAEDMVEKHREWMWKEMARFEEYSKQVW